MGWWLSASSMILMLGATTACITGVTLALCSSMRQSRCSRISLCCGACACEREIQSDELAKAELEHQQQPPTAPPPQVSPQEV
jgi:hypothetical protein